MSHQISKYNQSMQILEIIKTGKQTNHTTTTRKTIKTLIEKGYINRQPALKNYILTEKGAKTLEEHQKMVKKIRGGSHPSTDHQDQSQPE